MQFWHGNCTWAGVFPRWKNTSLPDEEVYSWFVHWNYPIMLHNIVLLSFCNFPYIYWILRFIYPRKKWRLALVFISRLFSVDVGTLLASKASTARVKTTAEGRGLPVCYLVLVTSNPTRMIVCYSHSLFLISRKDEISRVRGRIPSCHPSYRQLPRVNF